MEYNRNKILQPVITLIFWACFLMLPFVFFPYDRDKSAFQSNRFIGLYIFSMLFLFVFYYVNSAILIPKLLGRRQSFIYFPLVILVFFCYLSVYYLIWKYSAETQHYFARRHGRWHPSFWFFYFRLGPIILFLLAFMFSSVSKIIAQWFYAEKIKEEISKQQLQTELSLLRSQVNPHFLFNTLNSIYALTVSNNKKAPDAVMKLSHIMRYTLEESQSELVPLHNELAFIENYLELQKIRATDKVHVHFDVQNVNENVKIVPLLLIPFIENAFKFGVSTRRETNINVSMRVEGKKLLFSCTNDILPKINVPEGTGTGIVNVRRRLELLYKKNYQLRIDATENLYQVYLELDVI